MEYPGKRHDKLIGWDIEQVHSTLQCFADPLVRTEKTQGMEFFSVEPSGGYDYRVAKSPTPPPK